MSKPFPNSIFLSGNFAPWPMEGDIHDLVVEGEIPRELAGTFFRNSSNPQFAPGPNYHWFEGDGMIHSLRIEDGKAHYKNRFVRTARFEAERLAGEALFSGMGPSEPDPRIEGVSPNASNTHVLFHAGKLLSLWEAGPPHELDPSTLETIGIWDYAGEFRRERMGAMQPDIMTAHPKIDGKTGEWIGFGYSPMAPHLVYHEVSKEGKLTRSDELDVPFSAMMHDFIVSAEHAIFPVFPAVFDFAAMAETGSPLSWQPERGVQVGVLPRNGVPEDLVWISHDPCFSFHMVNAVSEGNTVVAELWETPRLVFTPDEKTRPSAPNLHRWTIDLDAGTVKDEKIDDSPGEFGRIDERYVGYDYTYTWSLGSIGIPGMDGSPDGFNSIFRYDRKTGSRVAHTLPEGDSFGEPVFVPRNEAAAEGDGFVLTVAHRRAEDRSDLIILDAQNIERAPLAICQLPHRVPYCFHGSWMPAE